MSNTVKHDAGECKEVTVGITRRNYKRLLEVAGALECRPDVLLNRFLLVGLEMPVSIVHSMDFEENGDVSRAEANEAKRRVTDRALDLELENWTME